MFGDKKEHMYETDDKWNLHWHAEMSCATNLSQQ